MENLISTISSCLLIGLGVIVYVGIFIKVLKNRRADVKTVTATIIDKQFYTEEILSNMSMPRTKENYILKFEEKGGKCLTFDVSEFVYKSCKVDDRGRLTYKGTKFVEFK